MKALWPAIADSEPAEACWRRTLMLPGQRVDRRAYAGGGRWLPSVPSVSGTDPAHCRRHARLPVPCGPPGIIFL